MANDLNLCQFIGRLGNPPEMKYLPNGDAVASFSIAVGSSWKDNQGQKQEATEWVRLSAFGKLAEIIGQYCGKGSRVYVSGKLKTRKWQDQSGADRYSTEIVANELQLLDGKDDRPAQPAQQAQPVQRQRAPQAAPPPPMDQFDDDIPFNYEAA
jgi:single-strand DNA-binding protein